MAKNGRFWTKNFFQFWWFFDQKVWPSPRKWQKMVDFEPKKFFEYYVLSMRTWYTAQTPVISDVCNLLPYFLSHMDAESPNRQYKGFAYTTYISGSLPRSLRFPSFMVQGPLVSSLGETVAVSTFTHYSMVRAEISCRNVNASRCHTALQHIDDSEVWSTIFYFGR